MDGHGTFLRWYYYQRRHQTSAVLLTGSGFRSMIVVSGNYAGSPGFKKTPKTGLTEAVACPERPTRCVSGLPNAHVSICISEQPKAADQLPSFRTGIRG